MQFKKLLSQPDISFRLKSVGLSLASPTDIRSWCFQYDNNEQVTPITGQIQNAKTIHYKSLMPEPGGLFCPTVFGQSDQQMSRDKMAYLDLTLPLSHIWYLKGSPSYLSVLLNNKRKIIQSIIYADCCLSFSKQTFHNNQNPLRLNHFNYFYNSIKAPAVSDSFANPSLHVVRQGLLPVKQRVDESSNTKTNQATAKHAQSNAFVLPNRWMHFIASPKHFFYCQTIFSAQNQTSHFWEDFPFFCQNHPKIFQQILEQKIGFDLSPKFNTLSSPSQNQTQLKNKVAGSINQTQSVVLELFDQQRFDKMAFDQAFEQCFSRSTLQSDWQSRSAYANVAVAFDQRTKAKQPKATHLSPVYHSYWTSLDDNGQHYFWLIYLARNFFHTLLKCHFPLLWSYQCFLHRKHQLIQSDMQRLKQKLKTYEILLTKLELNWEQNDLSNLFEDLLYKKSEEFLSVALPLSEGLQKQPGFAETPNVENFAQQQTTLGFRNRQIFTFFSVSDSASQNAPQNPNPKKGKIKSLDLKPKTFLAKQTQTDQPKTQQNQQPAINQSNKLYYSLLQEQTNKTFTNEPQQPVYDILQEKVHQCIRGLNKYLLSPQSCIENLVFQLPNYSMGSRLPLAYDYPYQSIPDWAQIQLNDQVCFLAQKSFHQISQMSFAYQILCDPLGLGKGLFSSDSKTLSVWLKTQKLKSKIHTSFELGQLTDKKALACSKKAPFITRSTYTLNKKVHCFYDCFSLLQWGYTCNNKQALIQPTSTLDWVFKKAYYDTAVDLKKIYPEAQCTKQNVKKQVCIAQSTWYPVFYTPVNSLEMWIKSGIIQSIWQNHRKYHIVFLKIFYGFTAVNVKAIDFPLFYIPLSCRYSHLPKGFLRNSKGILRTHGLHNPLGHKNFRKFIQRRFGFSLQKSRLVAQLKYLADNGIRETVFVQMQHSLHWVSSLVKSKSTLNKANSNPPVDRFSHWNPIAKQTVLNQFIWPFSNQNQKQTLDEKKSQFDPLLFLPSQSVCLFKRDKTNLTTRAKVAFDQNKKSKTKLTQEKTCFLANFSQLGWSSVWSESNHEPLLLNNKNATHVLFNHWEKGQWKPDAFFFLQQKKRLIHTIISIICHKINVFLKKANCGLVIMPSELDRIDWKNFDLNKLSIRTTERLKNRKLEHKQAQLFYEDPHVWLNFFNLPKKATMLESVKQFQTYFSLKTKLIKSKTVRLWFTKGFIKRHRLEQWPLNKLTWLVMIKLGSTISDFDQIMYSRLRFQRRTATLPLKHGFSHCLETFLEQNNQLKNTFYLVKQTFSWPIEDDYNTFVEFISPYPHKTDAIIPAYINKCITFDKPRTGAWAIHTLLTQFKPLTPYIKPPIYGYIDYLKNQIQALDKTMRFYTTFFQTFQVTPLKQKWHNDLQVGQLSTTMFDQFKKRRTNQKSNSIKPQKKQPIKVFYQRRLNRLQLKQKNLIRRLKLLLPFMHPNHYPAWLILTCLPILPPGLRPILSLNPGQFAIADLNKLYQQVIYRNERLKDLTELTVPFGLSNPYLGFRKLFRLYIRLIQQAVDALIDNGRSDSMAVLGNNSQPLKSLSESLRGKKGRFRQNLLGKRVDYSGRSVIVVGPELKVHQCGLPKDMAIVLFQPFLLRALMHQNYTLTYLQAKKLIRNQHPIIWPILDKILQSHPVLLNRAPTLHRLGIQAFQPCLVSGQAILLHPLVCSAFNADFDGDQMAVHVPLSYDACSEAWKLMWSRNQLFSPAMGDPVLMPTQDMVLGCYYLSAWDSIKHQRSLMKQTDELPSYGQWFTTVDQVLHAFWLHQLDEHQMIWLYWSENFELETHFEHCFEYQLNDQGAVYIFYDDLYQCLEPKKNQLQTWIKTTPGRVLLNKLFFKRS
jgi:DNA-directed RNA polymerase beta' subunit